VLARINDHAIHRLDQPLPWNWKTEPAISDSFNEIATVRIELRYTDPLIWRQLEVPTSTTLKVLHDIIQAVMGWFDYHLWEFTIGKQKYSLRIDDDWGTEPRIQAAKVRLRDVLKPRKNRHDFYLRQWRGRHCG